MLSNPSHTKQLGFGNAESIKKFKSSTGGLIHGTRKARVHEWSQQSADCLDADIANVLKSKVDKNVSR